MYRDPPEAGVPCPVQGSSLVVCGGGEGGEARVMGCEGEVLQEVGVDERRARAGRRRDWWRASACRTLWWGVVYGWERVAVMGSGKRGLGCREVRLLFHVSGGSGVHSRCYVVRVPGQGSANQRIRDLSTKQKILNVH